MTEPGRTPPRGGGGSKLGSVLTRKLGPLPVWGWGVLATGAAGAYYVIQQRRAGSSSTAASSTTTPADTVPPFIIQNYPLGGSAATGGTATGAPPAAGKKPKLYVTKAGDTLESIARRFNTDPGEIFATTLDQKSGFSSELAALVSAGGLDAKLPAGRYVYYIEGASTSGTSYPPKKAKKPAAIRRLPKPGSNPKTGSRPLGGKNR